MKQKFALPQINYLVFELVRIKVEDYLNAEYRAEQEEVIFFATKPGTFDYRLTARDAIAQTDNTVFLTKFDFQPERCSITGTFGEAPRLIAGSYMDGWSRLKQFENDIVRKSKKVSTPEDGDQDRYIYALNYYDFWWQRFGHINIQSFAVRGNAQENTQLPRYSCDYIIIGELIDALSKDPLLTSLKYLFGNGGIIDDALTNVNGLLADIEPYLNWAGLAYEGLEAATQLVQGAAGFLSGYDNSNRQIYSKVASLF